MKRPAGMSDEEFKQVQRMKRLEAEAQEEVRQTLAAQREAKMKKLHPPAPPPPKVIIMACFCHYFHSKQTPRRSMLLPGTGKQLSWSLGERTSWRTAGSR